MIADIGLTLDDKIFLSKHGLRFPDGGLEGAEPNNHSVLEVVRQHEVRQAVLEDVALRVSPYLYLLTVSDIVLREHEIGHDFVVAYIAEVLTRQLRAQSPDSVMLALNLFYTHLGNLGVSSVSEMKNAVKTGNGREAAVRMYEAMGEKALFEAGVFPEYVEMQKKRGKKPSGIPRLEADGSKMFRLAETLAKYPNLGRDFLSTRANFSATRIALNQAARDYMRFKDPLSRLMRLLMETRKYASPFQRGQIANGIACNDYRTWSNNKEIGPKSPFYGPHQYSFKFD